MMAEQPDRERSPGLLPFASAVQRTPRLATLALNSPLGALVRWVASIRASVHAKLLAGFLLVTLLVLLMGVVTLRTIAGLSGQTRLLDQAHERVGWSRQIEHAFAMQMHFTGMALLMKDDATIQRILRENNRFNDTLARLEQAARPEERDLIQHIRAAQDEAMNVVADIANLVRDGRLNEATMALLTREDPLYRSIAELVALLVKSQDDQMATLRTSVNAANRQALLVTGIVAASSIALALLSGFVISWSFILPVREAEGFLSRVTAGNFASTITVPNRDEFGALADRMNQMTRELQRLDEEQRQAAQELRGFNERLEQASRAKSQFLANMSHELRTPMNAILGFTEMLLDELYGEVPLELKEPLADIQANGKHLLRLINDVLDLSKIEAGRMELALADYSVQEVIDTVRSSLRSLAAERALEFVATTPPDVTTAYGDGKRMTQCLMNLAGNALKFTKRGRVEIGVERNGKMLVYRVADTGIGIPKEELENVFGEFRQVDATITREFGGTGLGLSITKKLVAMHGGRIWVESEIGKGSTFFVAVPIGGPVEHAV